jgi:hypothetical protein
MIASISRQAVAKSMPFSLRLGWSQPGPHWLQKYEPEPSLSSKRKRSPAAQRAVLVLQIAGGDTEPRQYLLPTAPRTLDGHVAGHATSAAGLRIGTAGAIRTVSGRGGKGGRIRQLWRLLSLEFLLEPVEGCAGLVPQLLRDVSQLLERIVASRPEVALALVVPLASTRARSPSMISKLSPSSEAAIRRCRTLPSTSPPSIWGRSQSRFALRPRRWCRGGRWPRR